ncbi:zinc finger protein 511 [Adelges cooleyi]|uniref:zinc finger protein 511 n=1 Tax=Adelges cooleyi TaxID=133065 RepID=UPI00217F4D82|nr:zinc finger protein 511 [Adelges cooleyi]
MTTMAMSSLEKLNKLLACGKRQKSIDDVLFRPIDKLLRIYRRDGIFEIEDEIDEPRQTDQFKCNVNGCTGNFTSMTAYAMHYNSNHRYTCIYCRKTLQSSHLLDLHVCETHDNFFSVSATRKPMYKCLIETCCELFWNADERMNHCKEYHKLTQSFLLHQGKKKNYKKRNNNRTQSGGTSSSSGLETMADLNMILD